MKEKYDFFAPGIRGYLQPWCNTNEFDLEQEVPDLDINHRKERSQNFFNEETTASRMLYVFGLLLEEDESRYNKKILSLTNTQYIDRLKKYINPKWVNNNKIIFKMSDIEKGKFFYNFIKRNISKLVKKVYTGKSNFIKEKLGMSLKFIFKEINFEKIMGWEYNFDLFAYIQWYNKKDRLVLVYLIKNVFYEKYKDKLNYQYYFRTGMLYEEESPEQIKELEIIRKAYFDNTPISISEFNKTNENSTVFVPFIVDLNREDFLQKTLWGRIQYFFRSKLEDIYYNHRDYNQAHLESYMSKRYFGV